jgi:hypothetical protein
LLQRCRANRCCELAGCGSCSATSAPAASASSTRIRTCCGARSLMPSSGSGSRRPASRSGLSPSRHRARGALSAIDRRSQRNVVPLSHCPMSQLQQAVQQPRGPASVRGLSRFPRSRRETARQRPKVFVCQSVRLSQRIGMKCLAGLELRRRRRPPGIVQGRCLAVSRHYGVRQRDSGSGPLRQGPVRLSHWCRETAKHIAYL